MTDSKKLDLILFEIQGLKTDSQSMKAEMQDMKAEMQDMKAEMQDMKAEIQDLKADLQNVKADLQNVKADLHNLTHRVSSLELRLENKTDKSIQLLAENFIELTNKLNQSIPAANKNLAYEVKVNYLIEEVDKLKKQVEELKNKIA